MEWVLFRGLVRPCLLASFFLLLIACSPKLNWRTVQAPEQKYTALFPGKPDKLERQIPFGDQEFRQTLEAVKIDDDIYSIGAIEIPVQQTDADVVKKITAQLQGNLLNRAKASGGWVVSEPGFFQSSQHLRLQTIDYYLLINQGGKDQQAMRVRWIARFDNNKSVRIYQVSVLHANANTSDVKALLSKEEYANFFNEFVPE